MYLPVRLGEADAHTFDDAVAALDDLFTLWLGRSSHGSRGRGRRLRRPDGGVRFAFYGRISTGGYQDPASSRRWQLAAALPSDRASRLHCCRVLRRRLFPQPRWGERPGAEQLPAEAARADRRFDAVVVGEYERAFTGRQALRIIAYLNAYGVAVWLPEVGGSVDPGDPVHRAVLMVPGHQSQREVLRARRRTTNAMSARDRNGVVNYHVATRPLPNTPGGAPPLSE